MVAFNGKAIVCRLFLGVVIGLLVLNASRPEQAKAPPVPPADVPSVEVFVQHFQAMMKKADFSGAESYCRAQLEKPSLQVDALVCLANVEVNLGRTTGVRVDTTKMGLGPKETGKVEIKDSQDLKKYFSPMVSYEPKRLQQALDYLDRAIALQPGRLDLWQGKAFILRESGRHQELLAHLTRAAKECPAAHPQDLNGYGQDYLQEGKTEQALDVLRTLAEAFPGDFIAWSDYGSMTAKSGDLEAALKLLQKAEKLGKDEMLLANLANLYIYLGHYREALPYLERLYRQNTESEEDQFRYLLGTAAVDQEEARRLSDQLKGSNHQTVRQLRKALAKGMKPEDALDAASNFYNSGQLEYAMLMLPLVGQRPQADYIRAAVYSQLKYHPGEIEALESYLRQAPPEDKETVAQSEANLGTAYLHTEKYSQAEQHLRRAVEAGLGGTTLYYSLGRALAGQEKYSEAIKAYQQAIAANDDPEYVGWSKVNLQILQSDQ